MVHAVVIDGNSLTLDSVSRVARDFESVVFPREARERVVHSRGIVSRALEKNEVVYGVTTGFGKLSDIRIPHEQIEQLQINLLRSHACGVGELLEEAEVRAALLLRANTLAKGFSGVRPQVIDTLVEMLNRGVPFEVIDWTEGKQTCPLVNKLVRDDFNEARGFGPTPKREIIRQCCSRAYSQKTQLLPKLFSRFT